MPAGEATAKENLIARRALEHQWRYGMKSVCGLMLTGLACLTGYAEGRPPNVVIFLADDMGIADAGCYGCKDIQTPGIDALAAAGVRLTNYYCAAPICAPSRAALLTGRYPGRIIPSAMGEAGIPTVEVTFAEIARTRGYATAALGKWHLGSTYDTQPNAQGFQYFLGHHASCIDSFSHVYYASEPWYHDLYRDRDEIFEDGIHLTDLITREALKFIDQNRERPFLLYAAYGAPHYPMVAHARFMEKYAHLPRARRDYAAMVAGLDESLGIIMTKLRTAGLAEHTLVFLASDNGSPSPSRRGEGGGSNAPYREFKTSLFDGGIHMPGIISWPGTLPQGQTRDQLTIAMDLLPTIAEAIGAELPPGLVLDGQSWLPLLRDPAAPGHDAAFFEWNGQTAVRAGRWKLVRNGFIDQHLARQNRAAGDDALFLSDMERDPGERNNLRRQHPDIVNDLVRRLDAWQAEIRPAAAPR